MKRKWMLLLAFVVLLGFSGVAGATLYDRGNGLIYDNVLNITWLQDANYAYTSEDDSDGWMTWAHAVAWAENLLYGGFSDWRLPTTVDGLSQWGYNGLTTAGYNITSSEMGYMYYVNLGNKGVYDTSGNPQPDWEDLTNVSFIDGTTGETRSFQYLQDYYWSGTEYSADPVGAWGFGFDYGGQGVVTKGHLGVYAWAVRPGDVSAPVPAPVPEPATMLLLASGLAGLGAFRKRIGRRRG